MGGSLVDREIIQSRAYLTGASEEVSNLNWKETFPITVFDAVRVDMHDATSMTLTQAMQLINSRFNNLQPIIPAQSANYIMTYGGAAGAVGQIPITNSIPWDSSLRSAYKIPTEKAVGELFETLGLLDSDGNVTIDPDSQTIRWSNIIGRPQSYDELGSNDDGFMTQKSITEAFEKVAIKVKELGEKYDQSIESNTSAIDDHINDTDNPHGITADQIGAATKVRVNTHINDIDNPHSVTKEQVGLGNVDNTSDVNKPVSTAVQTLIDDINLSLKEQADDIGNLKYVSTVDYNITTGKLLISFSDGDKLYYDIPISGLIDEIQFNRETKKIEYMEQGGYWRYLDTEELYIRYQGSTGQHINLSVDGTQLTGMQTFNASIIGKSITAVEIMNASLTTEVIADGAITTSKLATGAVTSDIIFNGSVTGEKIADLSIDTRHMVNRAITGEKLFTSVTPNMMLGVINGGTSPIWTKVTCDMIDDDAIRTIHVINGAITGDKLATDSVDTKHLKVDSVTEPIIKDRSVTTSKIGISAVTGTEIVSDVVLPGTPRMAVPPSSTAINNEIASVSWVRDFVGDYSIDSDQIADRSVDGSKLFSSNIAPRALVVNRAGFDPEWGFISHEMMSTDVIDTAQLIDEAVTSDKLYPESVLNKHIGYRSITIDKLGLSSVGTINMIGHNKDNYVLATVNADTNPEYVKVTGDMIQLNTITADNILTGTITPSLITPSASAYRVLSTIAANGLPSWNRIVNDMMSDRIIDGRVFQTSIDPHRLWGVSVGGEDPAWVMVDGEMIQDGVIGYQHIGDKQIKTNHLEDDIIGVSQLQDSSVTSAKIADGAVTGSKIFTSPYANRILAVRDQQYSSPEWSQVSTGMIEDQAVTKTKLFQSNVGYKVLGTTDPNVPPEYLMITSNFIVDNSILPNDLVHNFVLNGTPEITIRPSDDADNYQIADTHWVRNYVENNFEANIEILPVRPPDDACDANGNGNLIVDAQWVLDRLEEHCPTRYYVAKSMTMDPPVVSKDGGSVTTVIKFKDPDACDCDCSSNSTCISSNTIVSQDVPSKVSNGDIWMKF